MKKLVSVLCAAACAFAFASCAKAPQNAAEAPAASAEQQESAADKGQKDHTRSENRYIGQVESVSGDTITLKIAQHGERGDYDGQRPERSDMNGGRMPDGDIPDPNNSGSMQDMDGAEQSGGRMTPPELPNDNAGTTGNTNGTFEQLSATALAPDTVAGAAPDSGSGGRGEVSGDQSFKTMPGANAPNGEMPFDGDFAGKPGRGSHEMTFSDETVELNVEGAAIYVEKGGEKTEGSMSDITEGSIVVVKADSEGQAESVTVLSEDSMNEQKSERAQKSRGENGAQSSESAQDNTEYITSEDAQAIALEQTEGGEVVKCEFDRRDSEYDIEIRREDGTQVDVDVDAVTGKVVSVNDQPLN